MKILHLSTSDYSGGASIAAFRLHKAMLKVGINSSMLVAEKTRIQDKNIHLFKPNFYVKLFKRIVTKLTSKYKVTEYNPLRGLFSKPVFSAGVACHPMIAQADIIYLHWINRDFLSIADIKKILQLGKPVYWVLHDMWAITGGCHHSFECKKYETHCGNCPNLLNPAAKDASYRLFEKKLTVFDRYDNLQIITPSKWLGECAKKSRLFSKKKIQVRPNILDTSIYKPVDQQVARSVFNLPTDKKIILFGAIEGAINPYKGWSYLQTALQKLAENNTNIEAFIFGSEFSQAIVDVVPFPVHFSGHLHDDQSLCMLYNAADVFVASSLADNFPNTIVESLACGTPVVGFNVGGIPDLIDHKQNGYLAHYKDSDDLAEGIRWVLDCKEDLSAAARTKIEQMMIEVIPKFE